MGRMAASNIRLLLQARIDIKQMLLYTFPSACRKISGLRTVHILQCKGWPARHRYRSAVLPDSECLYILRLSGTVAELIGGGEVKVDTKRFANDLVTFRNRDDVLTLLIHLGYLAYDETTEKAHIPNEEIRMEFVKIVRDVKRDDTIRRVRESEQLIVDTVHGNAEAVAAQIEKIHAEESVLHYNSEQSLRSVIKRAYFSFGDEFVLFEELPAGDGYVDIVYLPKKDSILPALLIELKWNKTARGAIEQIKDRHYPAAIQEYGGEILLVGINYDKEAPAGKRKHTCVIEKYQIR